MTKKIVSFSMIALIVIAVSIVFRDPVEKTVDGTEDRTIEELLEENEQLQKENLQLKADIQLLESHQVDRNFENHNLMLVEYADELHEYLEVALHALFSESKDETDRTELDDLYQYYEDWFIGRPNYVENDELLFRVSPDPGLRAGESFGYLFHFSEPFETYEGKELAIYAYHEETEERVIAVSPRKVTEPSSGYSSLERFTANFELPIGGLWRYEVELDGELYGDVILSVKDSAD
ncbi:hypothetical protein [Evansella halocellulosilytica]|uniref:hypothetical protein n=1 Tax=Evansella halocellulosilytica TaxID=2011013 RepID=UPI000BB89B2E|nr:hypothetical protein [Evansella halocellulosilytica]